MRVEHDSTVTILSLDELTKDDLFGVEFDVNDETVVRFCMDVIHRQVILCEEKEDHIVGAETALLKEDSSLSEQDEVTLARALQNHFVGGSVFLQDTGAFVLIGGSSIEQGLRLHHIPHSTETYVSVEVIAGSLFRRLFPQISLKVSK